MGTRAGEITLGLPGERYCLFDVAGARGKLHPKLFNRALVWSEIALGQAWVCNPDLGCGLVAGFGPSRKARRPQHDWFFAGDGMVIVHALLAEGDYAQARQELEFILKYQDGKTGMIWHELSQSADWLDWSKFPTCSRTSISRSTFSTLSTNMFQSPATSISSRLTGLPSKRLRILPFADRFQKRCAAYPRRTTRQREQDELGDELMLSASWVSASGSFADLAASFDIRTPWPIRNVDGGKSESISPATYRLTVNASSDHTSYQDGTIKVTFEDEIRASQRIPPSAK